MLGSPPTDPLCSPDSRFDGKACQRIAVPAIRVNGRSGNPSGLDLQSWPKAEIQIETLPVFHLRLAYFCPCAPRLAAPLGRAILAALPSVRLGGINALRSCSDRMEK